MTDTYHRIPSRGTKVRGGTSVILDGGTINTGLSSISGIIVTCASSDTVATATTLSGPNATIAINAAGAGATGNQTIYWEAWSDQKV